MTCSFLTKDNIYKYISNMGNNVIPYSIAVGHENIYFLTPHFKFIKRKKINDNELLKTKIMLIQLIFMFQIVENTRLKYYENIKCIQFLIKTVCLRFQLIIVSVNVSENHTIEVYI